MSLELEQIDTVDDLQPLQRNSSLTKRATDMIRHAIVEGILQPGEVISVRELARRIHVSPTPIREALMLLSAVGLVEFGPTRVQIAAASAPAVREAFELREALEGMAARLAASRRTDVEAARIKEYAQLGYEAGQADDMAQFRKYDVLFHREIAAAAKSAQLQRYLSNALDLALTLRNLRSIKYNYPPSSAHMHLRIADAIMRQQPDEAEKASREHVRTVCERITVAQESTPSDN